MKTTLSKILILISLSLFPFFAYAASPMLSVSPSSVIQGEPAEIIVQNAVLTQVKSISFNGKKLGVFSYDGKTMAFIGVDIHQKAGIYQITAALSDGTVLQTTLIVGARPNVQTAFDIPETLGGDSTSSAQMLVSTLAQENQELLGLYTGTHAFWINPFKFPLPQITITDPYGYSRDTDGSSILHKGTDFRASIGTPVMAMNRGIVRLTKYFRDYGNTVIIDHGLGLMTFYMHLSKINVNVGELVQQGQIIGLSGNTGDAVGPHLHITVRIDNISIDPMKFMAFFKQ